MTLKLSWYLLAKFSRVPFTIVLIPLISTIIIGTLLNIGKRYENDLRVILDQWPKLHLGFDALSNQKILNGIYLPCFLGCIAKYQHCNSMLCTMYTLYNLGKMTAVEMKMICKCLHSKLP